MYHLEITETCEFKFTCFTILHHNTNPTCIASVGFVVCVKSEFNPIVSLQDIQGGKLVGATKEL